MYELVVCVCVCAQMWLWMQGTWSCASVCTDVEFDGFDCFSSLLLSFHCSEVKSEQVSLIITSHCGPLKSFYAFSPVNHDTEAISCCPLTPSNPTVFLFTCAHSQVYCMCTKQYLTKSHFTAYVVKVQLLWKIISLCPCTGKRM